MNELIQKRCEACRVGAPLATEQEKHAYLKILPDWEIIVEDGIEKLKRDINCKDFKEALAYTNKIAQIAEEEMHHPDITTRYGSVTVIWYTHKIQGLHLNDFIMAAKTDTLI